MAYLEQTNVQAGYIYLNDPAWRADYSGGGGPNGPIGNNAQQGLSRHTVIRTFLCPGDIGPNTGEIGTTDYGMVRGNYRACTGSGDMYGNATDNSGGPWGVGVFGVVPFQTTDPAGKI